MNISKLNPGNTSHANCTICNQLGIYVVMSSPLQMACDLPENYERFMDAFQFIKDVAMDWDRSIYLEAEPGRYVTVARKSKKDGQWFVGNVTGDREHTSEISLDFLEPGKKYIAHIYCDGKDADYKDNPQSYEIRKVKCTSKSRLKIASVAAGGFAISFSEIVN